MAVSKVRRLELVAHAQSREEILKALRDIAAVHISDIKQLFPDSETTPPSFLKKALAKVQSKLDQTLFCSLFFERFMPKPSALENLLKPKPLFTEKEAEETIANFRLEDLYEECTSLETELAKNDSNVERIEATMADVAHWLRLDHPLELIQDTAKTHVSLGISESRSFNPMIDELDEASVPYHIRLVERSRTSVSMVTLYAKSDENSIGPILRKHGWRAIKLPGLEGTPAEIIERSRQEIKDIQQHDQDIREHIVSHLVPLRQKLLLLYDHYSQELQSLQVQHSFMFTSRTFFITGWIVAKQEEALKQRLAEATRIVEIKCSDPGPDDTIPILLENNRLTKPFTLITEMYGRPQYREFDPTPFFTPFFVLFFAICLGDAGYGLILAIGSYIALKKFQISGGARKLLQILFIGGLANIVIGLLTGGVFTIESTKLPMIFKALRVFSPTEQVVLFLYLSFALGVFQVLFGLGIKMAHNIREGDTVGAILDQGLWMLFLISLVPLVFKYIFGGAVSEAVLSPAANAAIILAVALVLTQGRKVKIIALRPLMGLLKLYDAMGYFSDVLSYARLMALGLATAFLGMAFNQMAEMTLGIPYGIGYVIAILLLIFSHLFNLIINCLGAFVHSLRLQYLEFFSKFFIGGGEPFVPFAESREYTVIQSELEKTY